eukprot:TRINITY_DN19486_c0_g2_i1.p1 TRINITY_DN19486_c0_g2~~TRINITY_DN19486_c0_g2_i1.p1  ORF type:complete len:866 (-),score=245.82 TRINITY_DN19486_c0_g2_i1:52-2502(-)
MAFDVGSKFDTLSPRQRWCITMVADVQLSKVLIHYMGWPTRHDEWIEKESSRLAAPFTHTKYLQPIPDDGQGINSPEEKTLAELGFTEPEIAEAIKPENCKNEFQNSVNFAFYASHLKRLNQAHSNKKDGYTVGLWLDIRDKFNKWCIAEITQTADEAIRVHYFGWGEKYDEWVPKDSGRIAPAFQNSRFNQARLESATRPQVRFLTMEGFTEAEAEDAIKNCDNDLQNALNYCYFQRHLKKAAAKLANDEKLDAEAPDDSENPEPDEGFYVGQRVDIKDLNKKWCVGQIKHIQSDKLRVHYLGWSIKYGEWIPRRKGRVAPLFTYTRYTQSVGKTTNPSVQALINAGFSNEEAEEALKFAEGDLQNALNYAYYSQYCEVAGKNVVPEEDGLGLNLRMDVKDKRGTWCVAEILALHRHEAKVFYLGRPLSESDWISRAKQGDESNFAPLFSRTKENQPKNDELVLEEKHILSAGFSKQEAAKVISESDGFLQNALNRAFYDAYLRCEADEKNGHESLVKVGNGLDVLDQFSNWCVAEVLQVQPYEFKVRYVGWSSQYDTWIPKGALRTAPLFTHTTKKQTRVESASAPEEKHLVTLGFTVEEAVEALKDCDQFMQNAVNSIYYSSHLRASTPEYAALMQVGTRVDVQDSYGKWCVAEIMELKTFEFKVHFLGWNNNYDCWIPKGSIRVAQEFTRTDSNQPRLASATPPQIRFLVEMGFTEEEAHEAIVFCEDDLQNAINRAFHTRFVNMLHIPNAKDIERTTEEFRRNPKEFAFIPNPHHITSLVGMGFNEEQATIALTVTNNNLQEAIDMLVGQF